MKVMDELKKKKRPTQKPCASMHDMTWFQRKRSCSTRIKFVYRGTKVTFDQNARKAATFCFCSCAFMLIELDSGHYYESSSSPWPFGFHHCFPWRFSCCLLTSIASRTLIFPWDLKPIHPWFWSMPFTLYQ